MPDKPNFPTTDEFVANPVHVHAYMIQGVRGDDKHPNDVAIILHNPNMHRLGMAASNMVIHLNAKMISRHFPRVGDYYVIQADDYRYINPVDVFERKYRPLAAGILENNVDPSPPDSTRTP